MEPLNKSAWNFRCRIWGAYWS